MILPRKWKTPRALRTPKAHSGSDPANNPLESSMMSIEDHDDEHEPCVDDDSNVHININSSGTPESKSPIISAEERKRAPVTPAAALLGARKRMRMAQSTMKKNSTRKQFLNPTQAGNQESNKKLDFLAPEEPSAVLNSKQQRERMEKVESFEKTMSIMDATAIKEAESQILWMKQQCSFSDTAFLEKSTTVLLALNRLLSKLAKAEECKTTGGLLYRSQRYTEAELEYSEAIQLDPSRAVHYSNRAAVFIMLGKYAEAIEDCNKAITLDPSFIRAYFRSARASLSLGDAFTTYHKLNRLMRMQEEQGKAGADILREASEMAAETKSFTDCLDQSEELLRKEDGISANKKAMEALLIAPASLRARALDITARLVASLKSEENLEALKVAIGELEARVGQAGYLDVHKYGMFLWYRAHVTEAAAFLALVHDWAPSDASEHLSWKLVKEVEDYLRRARRLRKEGRFEDATRFCDQAMDLCTQNDLLWAKICILRANINVLAGRFVASEHDCYQALKRAPQYFAARIVLAKALIGSGRFIEAEKEILLVETGFSLFLKCNHREEIREVRDGIRAKMAAATNSAKQRQENRHHAHLGSQSQGTRCQQSSGPSKVNDENDMFAFLNAKQKVSHYIVLGVDRTATKEEIRKAYRLRALKYHPDKNSDPRAPEAFKRIAEAMTVVSSPTKRRLYDLSIY